MMTEPESTVEGTGSGIRSVVGTLEDFEDSRDPAAVETLVKEGADVTNKRGQ